MDERDSRLASDDRTPAQRWLGEPQYHRSALHAKRMQESMKAQPRNPLSAQPTLRDYATLTGNGVQRFG
jgi:hypothetical protein